MKKEKKTEIDVSIFYINIMLVNLHPRKNIIISEDARGLEADMRKGNFQVNPCLIRALGGGRPQTGLILLQIT